MCSAEEGEKIVQVALEKFGGVHILVANAGILRDKSFTAMTEQEWDLVVAIHLRLATSTLNFSDDTDFLSSLVPHIRLDHALAEMGSAQLY